MASFDSQPAPSAGVPRLGGLPMPNPWVSCALAVSSLTLLFALSFPWQHHNESLVWDIDLHGLSFWASLLPRPVHHVASYRPLGIALAWLSFQASGGGLWLQQLINYAVTVAAWLLALWSVRDRLSFAWLSFICAAAFFPGYIYLFHLHGVFYGPLLVFVAWLMIRDEQLADLGWADVSLLVSVATVAALFHTFAFLLLAAFLGGRCLENLVKKRAVSVAAVAVGIAVCGCGVLLLLYGSQSAQSEFGLTGWLLSYQLLQVNWVTGLVAAPLAVLACSAMQPARLRHVCIALAVIASMVLLALHLPLLLVWIGVCIVKSVLDRRLGLAALIGACALLPIATGTGSPTYALAVLLPVCKSTVDGLETRGLLRSVQRNFAVAALCACLLVYAVFRIGAVPQLDRLFAPLLAERQKTDQMMQMFAWLDTNPQVTGELRLCQPADYPVRSPTPAQRRYRAPTDAYSFAYYVQARYGERLTRQTPRLMLCFGGQSADGAALHTIEGRWAGTAALERR